MRSVGFSAQEIACYWIHFDLTHYLLGLFKLFCLKNVRHQTAISHQLTACTTLITTLTLILTDFNSHTYDTRFHSLAFPPLLLADCLQALWVGMHSNIQKDDDEDCKNA